MGDISCQQLEIFAKHLHLNSEEINKQFKEWILPYLGDGKSKWWDSWVTDDNSPYDWSIVLSKAKQQLRIILEPLPDSPSTSLECMKQVSFKFLDHITSLGACRKPLTPIWDFLNSSWAKNCWFGVEFGSTPFFKLYYGGKDQQEYELILKQLGCYKQFQKIKSHLPNGYIIEGMSIDLLDQQEGRTKLYIRLKQTTQIEISNIIHCTTANVDTSIQEFLDEFFPKKRESQVSLSRYTSAQMPEEYLASEVTLTFYMVPSIEKAYNCRIHLPVRFYFDNDRIILDKLSEFISNKISLEMASMYTQLISDYCYHRNLDQKCGIQSVVSYSCTKDGPELAIYISPELFARNQS